VFTQIADGIDDETWEFHRQRADYSRSFAEGVKDETLAAEARRIETVSHFSPAESRAELRKSIERIYTLPA